MKIFQIFLLVFLSANAMAQQSINTTALNSVVQGIVTGSGPVTKSEYDQFWAQFGANSAADRQQFIDIMKARFVLIQEYQKEVWSCAEQAWNSHVVPRCERANNKITLLTAEMKKNNSEGVITPMTDYSNKLLNAAANRGSIENPNGGGEVKVTLEMIRSTRDGLDKMLVRLGQVLRPNF